MSEVNPKVDLYLRDGCMRCELGGTPACKVHDWQEELIMLRKILLSTELVEDLKWGMPCYTFEGKNILILSAFKDFSALNFFKGVLLKDPGNVLVKPGENSQSARFLKFTNLGEIKEQEAVIRALIAEAIEVEKAGLKVDFKDTSQFDVPEEFQARLEEDPVLKAAFEALTPGRQRGYLLYFAGAKQSATRASRVEKYIPKIMEGKGFHDR